MSDLSCGEGYRRTRPSGTGHLRAHCPVGTAGWSLTEQRGEGSNGGGGAGDPAGAVPGAETPGRGAGEGGVSEEGAQPGRFPDPVMAPEGQEAAGRGAGLAAGGGEGQGRAQARPAHPAFSTPESPTLHCVPLVSVTVQGERGALGGGADEEFRQAGPWFLQQVCARCRAVRHVIAKSLRGGLFLPTADNTRWKPQTVLRNSPTRSPPPGAPGSKKPSKPRDETRVRLWQCV